MACYFGIQNPLLNRPVIADLFVINGVLSPDAEHSSTDNTNEDIDEVTGIGPGSIFLYLLYTGRPDPDGQGGQNNCHSTADHRVVFDAVVLALSPCNTGGGGGGGSTGGAGGPMCLDTAGELSIDIAVPDPFTIRWDDNEHGQVRDGGSDMYDNGNKLSTSICPTADGQDWEGNVVPGEEAGIAPWTTDMTPTPSDCFGSGGSSHCRCCPL